MVQKRGHRKVWISGHRVLKMNKTFSVWGKEDPETVSLIKEAPLKGYWLNLAGGDGRYVSLLLKKVTKLEVMDKDRSAIKKLLSKCPKEFKNKLKIKIGDITEKLPYPDRTFDGIFCTGTLHLFSEDILINIFSEIERVLKSKGSILIDFATNIKRKMPDGTMYKYPNEPDYKTSSAEKLLKKLLKNFDFKIYKSKVAPQQIKMNSTGHIFSCNFFLIHGKRKK